MYFKSAAARRVDAIQFRIGRRCASLRPSEETVAPHFMARSRGKVIKLFSARRRSGIRAPWDQMILLVQTLDTVHYIWTLPDISAPREFRERLTPRAPREKLPAAGPIEQALHPCSRRLQAHGLAAGALRGLVSFVCVKGPYQATGPSSAPHPGDARGRLCDTSAAPSGWRCCCAPGPG